MSSQEARSAATAYRAFWRWLYSGGGKVVRTGNAPSKFKVPRV